MIGDKQDESKPTNIGFKLDFHANLSDVYDAIIKKKSISSWLTKHVDMKGRYLKLSFGEDNRYWAKFGTFCKKTPSQASISWTCKSANMYGDPSPWNNTKMVFKLTLLGKDKTCPITRLEFNQEGLNAGMVGHEATEGFWAVLLGQYLSRYLFLKKEGIWPDHALDWNSVFLTNSIPINLVDD